MAAPQRLLSSSSTRSDHGYDFEYSTNDLSRKEHAVLIPRQGFPEADTILSVHGSYSFFDENFREYTVNYIADVNGYRANITVVDPPEDIIDPNALKSLVG
ncbi:hypothetical protein DMENIID0001_046080 [Sergentomyia squamirostris]